ncbi:unnamed protein product, partial [Symbiodinium sp. KB8]
QVFGGPREQQPPGIWDLAALLDLGGILVAGATTASTQCAGRVDPRAPASCGTLLPPARSSSVRSCVSQRAFAALRPPLDPVGSPAGPVELPASWLVARQPMSAVLHLELLFILLAWIHVRSSITSLFPPRR